jgi:histidinol-phosphate aminotransferase
VFAGSGSDEVIELLIKVFVGPGEHVVIAEPTYGMYGVASRMAGVAVSTAVLSEDFSLDPAAVLRFAKTFRGIVVVDEAYVEFSGKPSLTRSRNPPRNLVVLRTLSKAWGLAGLRVGYAVADPEVVGYLDRVKTPYNLNRVSAALAERALSRSGAMRKAVATITAERERLARALAQRGFFVFPSRTNFLLVRKPGAPALVPKLAKRFGVIIRDVSEKPRLKDCVRISVGTSNENRKLLRGMDQL